jgi:hypothetical protein
MKMLCLVESDHGVNIMGMDRDYIIGRLSDGVDKGHVKLGGTYLPDLKQFSKMEAARKAEQEADSVN